MEPWPADRIKRSRLGHLGSFGSKLSPLENNEAPISAAPNGNPRCPELHVCTASIASPLAWLAASFLIVSLIKISFVWFLQCILVL